MVNLILTFKLFFTLKNASAKAFVRNYLNNPWHFPELKAAFIFQNFCEKKF